ncbi:MAG: hypothetical protein ACE5GJ_04250 [Gemmatimonadota bacterium]
MSALKISTQIPGLATDLGQPSTLVDVWLQFTDFDFVAKLVLALVLACVLAALIAYHPRTYGKVAKLDELESAKTLIMFSTVGAVIGTIVLRYPYTALVIFGIGGLLRFRTNLGQAKDTGRVILMTLVGLCAGLELPHVAVVTTAFAYLLIYVLEGPSAFRVVVKGLDRERLSMAAGAYRALVEELGCVVLSEKKNFKKKQTALVFRAPRQLKLEDLEQAFEEGIPPELAGAVDWEAS